MEVTMRFDLGQASQLLARTPPTLRALLAGVDDAWLDADEGEGTFSPAEVVGHLLEAERTNWLPRARVIRAGDPSAAFPPFDRYAHRRLHAGKRLEELLDEFAALRHRNLAEVASWGLDERALDARAVHTEFGPVTLRQLLSTWVVHDLGHLAQVARVMAKRYREDVGPWERFLPILRDRPKPAS